MKKVQLHQDELSTKDGVTGVFWKGGFYPQELIRSRFQAIDGLSLDQVDEYQKRDIQWVSDKCKERCQGKVEGIISPLAVTTEKGVPGVTPGGYAVSTVIVVLPEDFGEV